jgi:competence ComEA-like helix-hairpin-helix protein
MFHLTTEERRVILFVAVLVLIGMGADFLLKHRVPSAHTSFLTHDISKIDLNLADKELLMSLPGIGEKLAQRIIEYRQQKGLFQDIDDLKKIKGISVHTYEKIKDTLIIR